MPTKPGIDTPKPALDLGADPSGSSIHAPSPGSSQTSMVGPSIDPASSSAGQIQPSSALLSVHTLSGTGLSLNTGVGLVASSADRTPGTADLAREQFGAEELAIVLSHFDIGVIHAMHEFRRGSRRAPKMLLKADRGAVLLKRRAPGRDEAHRVQFSHRVQLKLSEQHFPLPKLLKDRATGDTLVKYGGRIYELFEFIPGTRYDATLPATSDAGHALALFHKLIASVSTEDLRPTLGYHAVDAIDRQFEIIKQRAEQGGDDDLSTLCGQLLGLYHECAKNVDAIGIRHWPAQLVHGDWHPGNTLYRGPHVVAVIDFDSLRLEPRVLDVANGALQFSITMDGEDLDRWPDHLDESRFKRFCRGYDAVEECILSTAEIEAMPALMIEALILEAAAPIAATGSFAGHDGGAFLRMVDRKCRWMLENKSRLVRLISD
jgi:homoserine kinase type II